MSTIYGIFNDEEVLLKSVKQIRLKEIQIKEVYTPFHVHGLDEALGLQRTRMGITSFIYGAIGLSLALLMMWYMMIYDWPRNIGGKPSFSLSENLLSFIPVLFECTVLCAAHLMVLTFLFRSWLFPGVTPKNPDPRTTDDKFCIEIEVEGDNTELIALLKETGVEEIKEK